MGESSEVAGSVLLGLLIRMCMMLYGEWQDANMVVKYTDVDYYVFSDAAKYTYLGDSPYKRSTYRYTPLLAWMLIPNLWFPAFGKVVFVLCDLMAVILIYQLLKRQNCSHSTSLIASQVWNINPLSMAVSTRGNAESFMSVLVLATLYLLSVKPNKQQKSETSSLRLICAGALYGTAVHTKIYPVTFALPIYLYLSHTFDGGERRWTLNLPHKLPWDILPNRPRILFCSSSILIFCGLTAVCYCLYGEEFLQETYFYHVTRRDTRHNFSPYFYMLYLTADHPISSVLGLLAFIPQLFLLILTSIKYYHDLPFCTFLHTFIFVTFNKVCTSQYFLWYICLLPNILPFLNLSLLEGLSLLVLWFIGQGTWLLPAYYLEFQGINSFLWIWAAGLLFFSINIGIICKIISYYRYEPLFDSRSCVMPRKPNNLSLSFISEARLPKKEL